MYIFSKWLNAFGHGYINLLIYLALNEVFNGTVELWYLLILSFVHVLCVVDMANNYNPRDQVIHFGRFRLLLYTILGGPLFLCISLVIRINAIRKV